jgi:hypothetical protein
MKKTNKLTTKTDFIMSKWACELAMQEYGLECKNIIIDALNNMIKQDKEKAFNKASIYWENGVSPEDF